MGIINIDDAVVGIYNRWTDFCVFFKDNMMRKSNLMRFVCWSVLIMGAMSYGAGYSISVDKMHPDFTLPSIADGEPVSLSDFRGRKVLLVHFASW